MLGLSQDRTDGDYSLCVFTDRFATFETVFALI